MSTRTKIKRIVRGGYINFIRNGLISSASVLALSVTLFVIGGLVFLQAVEHTVLHTLENTVDVTVYFTPSAGEDKILTFKSSVEAIPEVASTVYTSAEDALAKFRLAHENDYLSLQALDELSSNPLGASLGIHAQSARQYEAIVNTLQTDTALTTDTAGIIDHINYNQNADAINRLNTIIAAAGTLGFLLTLVLVLLSIIVTVVTQRLVIHFAREEIGIMKLVGADNAYVRGPFVFEAVISGVLATFIVLLVYIPICLWFSHHMTEFLGIDLWNYYISNFFELLVILLGAGAGAGAIASFIAVHFYLRK